MADLAALIIDSENLDFTIKEVYGSGHLPDIDKIRTYLISISPGRTILWTRYYVSEQSSEHINGNHARTLRFQWLRRNGVRVIVSRPKPFNRLNRFHENDTADFAIVDGIHLAQSKASTIIVISGDGHLSNAIRNAHERHGCRIEVMSSRSSLSSDIEADRFHLIDEIAKSNDLSRTPKPKLHIKKRFNL